MNYRQNKAHFSAITIFLLILLGIRFFFQIIALIAFNFFFLFIIFAGGYLFALIGVYSRSLYGPLIALIVICSDILIGFMFTSGLTGDLLFALLIDFIIFILAINDYSLISRYQQGQNHHFKKSRYVLPQSESLPFVISQSGNGEISQFESTGAIQIFLDNKNYEGLLNYLNTSLIDIGKTEEYYLRGFALLKLKKVEEGIKEWEKFYFFEKTTKRAHLVKETLDQYRSI